MKVWYFFLLSTMPFLSNDAALDANKTNRKRHFGITARNSAFFSFPEGVFAADASKLRFKKTSFPSDDMQIGHLGNGRFSQLIYTYWEDLFFWWEATFKVIRLVRVLGFRWIYQRFYRCSKYVL